MAIYKVENISFGIDGTEMAASSVSFKTSNQFEAARRLGKNIGGQDFSTTGPQKSSMTVNFYLTQSSSADPIFSLLSGLDLIFLDSGNNALDPDVGIMTPYLDANDNLKWGGHSSYHTAKMENNGGAWAYTTSDGFTSTSDSSPATQIFPWSIGGGFDGLDYYAYRTGSLGCVTGSTIQLGGTNFASGAALTSLGFSFSPFSPILCKASFDIFNEVTGTFPESGSNLGITASDIAHGMFSSFSGVTGISEVESLSWNVSATRIPRYVVGKKNVKEIATTVAKKEVSFQGWGQSTQILEDPPTSLTISIGSQGGTFFTDTVSGLTRDDSFDLPEVGIMSKNFSIDQNLI
jgi:hypothetical protein